MKRKQEIENGPEAETTALVRKALFRAVEDVTPEDACLPLQHLMAPSNKVDTLIAGMTAKEQQNLVLSTIQKFEKPHAKRFFSGLKSLVETIVNEETYVPASAFSEEGADESQDDYDDVEITPDAKSSEALLFLKHAAMTVDAYLKGRLAQDKRQSKGMPLNIPAHVLDVAMDLHQILFSLSTAGPDAEPVQVVIMNLCEAWWHANGPSRDNLIVQCLPLLVMQALESKDLSKSNMKRLYQLRKAFNVIDFTNPSSDSLRDLLMRVASNPLCLKLQEGKGFLASLLQDPELVTDLHLAIKAQIPEVKQSILKSYGEIYLKAWKDAPSDESREGLEHIALQDLTRAAIQVTSNATRNSLMVLLEPIHTDKKTPEVAGLLYRLYGPILFRMAAASNPRVRVNAVDVLAQVFPLHDPAANQMQAAVEKASNTLKSSLQDSDPSVRVAGSQATANVLVMFWEALPAADIRALLNHIVMEHSSDATSAAVRSTALESITALLEIPQSHAVLRALLPLLGNLIHDKTEKVRLAAAKMLLKVKQVPGIRFYHVVPVTNIAAQMAEEGRLHPSPRTSVAKELTALMLNSYFPQGTKVQASDQIKRTMTFLMSEPEAAAVFYANLADQLDLEAVGKFVSMLLTCLGTSVKADQADEVKNTKGGQKRRRKGDVEDSEKKEKKALSASNTPLMASLAETICTLWSAVQGPIEKSENEELRDTILKSFEQVDLVSAIAHFEQKAMDNAGSTDDAMKTRDDCFRTCAALLRCAGKLPKDTIEGMVTHISDTLTSISKSELDYSRPHISAYFALLCLWDMTEEITSSVAESIDAAFKYGVGYSSPIFGEKRQSRGRGKTFNKPVVPVFSPSIVWGVVQDILQGNDPSTVIIRDSILASDKASETLQSALEKGIFTVQSILQSDSLGRTYDSSEVEFLLSVCEAYGRFALHKEAKNADGVSLSPQGHILLNWTSERVVPSFELTNGGESSLRDLDLSRISNASDSVMMPGSPGLASPPRRKADLKRTPNKPETSSVFDESADSLTEVGAFLAGAVANALLQSTNVIFSDWVAVGGTGTKEVSDAAIQWFNKIYTTSDEFLPKNTKVELLPSFCRLACQLGRFSNDFSLLQEIIAIYDEEEWSEESSTSIYKTIYTLLAIRSNESVKIQEGVVSTTLKAAEELAENSEEEDSFQIADFFSEVWIHKKGSILSALYAIVNNRQTCHCLAKKLVSDLGLFAEGLDSKTIFKAKCLSFLLTQSNYQADVEKIVRDIDLDRFTGGEIKDVMTQLLPSTAA